MKGVRKHKGACSIPERGVVGLTSSGPQRLGENTEAEGGPTEPPDSRCGLGCKGTAASQKTHREPGKQVPQLYCPSAELMLLLPIR